MKALVLCDYDPTLTALTRVHDETVADPKIVESQDAVIRIGGAGVCRTDLHFIEGI